MSATQPQPADRSESTLSHATALAATHGLLMTQARRTVARDSWEMHRTANRRAASPSVPRPMSRVEHRMDHPVADLGAFDGASRHHAALASFTASLCQSRRTEGEVMLIDTASGCVVAGRTVAPPLHQTA